MRWTPQTILNELRTRQQRGDPTDSHTLQRTRRSLVSAAKKHFGSFKKAVKAAELQQNSRGHRPKWTKQAVIRVIKEARRRGTDLCWSAVITRDSLLRKAAFAAVQKRLFGGWPRALEAAGVDADSSRRHQSWDKTVVVAELKQLHADREATNSFAVRMSNPALHAAAVRHLGSFAAALRAAGIKVQRRRRSSLKMRTGK